MSFVSEIHRIVHNPTVERLLVATSKVAASAAPGAGLLGVIGTTSQVTAQPAPPPPVPQPEWYERPEVLVLGGVLLIGLLIT